MIAITHSLTQCLAVIKRENPTADFWVQHADTHAILMPQGDYSALLTQLNQAEKTQQPIEIKFGKNTVIYQPISNEGYSKC